MKFAHVAHALLTEAAQDRIAYVKKTWPNLTDKQLDSITKADPSNTKEFMPWIARMVVAGHLAMPEDEDKTHSVLKQFHWLKTNRRIRGTEADIIRYKTFGDLARKVDEMSGTHGTDETPMIPDGPGMTTIYFEHPWQVIETTTSKATVQLASNTHWCVNQQATAAHYLATSNLYFIFKNGRKFALLHHSDGQIRDTNDNLLTNDEMREVAPILWHARLVGPHNKGHVSRAMLYVEPRHKTIEKNPERALEYAREVAHGPFPEGEDAIATDAALAVRYAADALHGPFPKGEPEIAKDGRYAYAYALHILHKAFPAGEKSIIDVAASQKIAIAGFAKYVSMVGKTEGPDGIKRLIKLSGGARSQGRVAIKGVLDDALVTASRTDSDVSEHLKNPRTFGSFVLGLAPDEAMATTDNAAVTKHVEAGIKAKKSARKKADLAETLVVFKDGEPFAHVVMTEDAQVLDTGGQLAPGWKIAELMPALYFYFQDDEYYTEHVLDLLFSPYGHPERAVYLHGISEEEVLQSGSKRLAKLWVFFGNRSVTKKVTLSFIKKSVDPKITTWRARIMRKGNPWTEALNALISSGRLKAQLDKNMLEAAIDFNAAPDTIETHEEHSPYAPKDKVLYPNKTLDIAAYIKSVGTGRIPGVEDMFCRYILFGGNENKTRQKWHVIYAQALPSDEDRKAFWEKLRDAKAKHDGA